MATYYILSPVGGICDETDCATEYPITEGGGTTRTVEGQTCSTGSECLCRNVSACNYGLLEYCIFCSEGLGEYCDPETQCCGQMCNDPMAENFHAMCGTPLGYYDCVYCDEETEIYVPEACNFVGGACILIP